MNKSLKPVAQRILAKLEFDARIPSAQLERELDLRSGSVQTALKDLSEQGIVRYYPFINPYLLGYRNAAYFLTLSPLGLQKMGDLLEHIKNEPSAVWLAELGGTYHLGLNLLHQTEEELVQCFERIYNKFPLAISSRRFAIQRSIYMLGTRYLYGTEPVPKPVVITDTGSRVEIDDVDRKILSRLQHASDRSEREISRALGLPHSTTDSRLRRLEKSGVIARYIYLINPLAIGFQSFKLVIISRGSVSALREKLLKILLAQPWFPYLIESVGNWDFEVILEAPDIHVAGDAVRRLQAELGDLASSLEMLPQGKEYQVANVPRYAQPTAPSSQARPPQK